MRTPLDYTAICSAIAASCSVITAIIAIFIAAGSRKIQERLADFSNCMDIVSKLGDAQRRVFLEKCENKIEFEFCELLNLLEALALMINDGRIAPSTKKYTTKFLAECLIWIDNDDSMKITMNKLKTSDETYGELKKFENRQCNKVNNLSIKFLFFEIRKNIK